VTDGTTDPAASSLVERALQGDRRAAGRLISVIEDDASSVEGIMRTLYPHTGRAYTVGLTGPPGAGKSTVVDELIRVLREQQLRVGVVAVDPNSPFTGGAILGDRIRMMRHASDQGVFIRSMGARGHLGGLAIAAFNTVLLFDAIGMDVVLIETVGVGQSELEITGAADTTVVVIPPGLGDGVQAIKAGIMEIADIFVVNKADHPQAQRTVADIRELLRMNPSPLPWPPPIVRTIATQNQGIDDLWHSMQKHRQYLHDSGELRKRRKLRVEREVVDLAEQRLREQILRPKLATAEFETMVEQTVSREMDPYQVVERVLPRSAGEGK
jgi:LAO/AO transport system kinase